MAAERESCSEKVRRGCLPKALLRRRKCGARTEVCRANDCLSEREPLGGYLTSGGGAFSLCEMRLERGTRPGSEKEHANKKH